MCSRCLTVQYCSRQHQLADWKQEEGGHEESCVNRIKEIAQSCEFKLEWMHVELKPKRGSRTKQPWRSWLCRSHSDFKCGRKSERKNWRCGNRWHSAKCGFDVNLRSFKIVKVWRQKCQHCEFEVEPRFTDPEEALKSLFVWLRDLRDSDRNEEEEKEIRLTAPHQPKNCELCGYGKHPICTRPLVST